MSGAYYNEIDAYAAEWLRNLIAAGHIAPGEVDERSIEDVTPDDLRGFTQCHFFAGIGVWSRALRSAGWPDDHPVWTGSCPCQPFSAAGQGKGFADERHLWPAFHHLIRECRPPAVIGEQVASKDADTWIDLVQTDLEALGYSFGAVPFPSASVGAPHIRDRLYWVSNTGSIRPERRTQPGSLGTSQDNWGLLESEGRGSACRLGDNNNTGLEGLGRGHQAESGRLGEVRPTAETSESGGLADDLLQQRPDGQPRISAEYDACRGHEDTTTFAGLCGDSRSGPTNGHWRDADWLFCRDGKWRPVEPRPQPLVDGSAESLGRVRPDIISKIEEEINAASMESEVYRPEVLRDLQEHLGETARRVWTPGRVPGLHEAPFLLAFLRQLQAQGWGVSEDKTLLRPEIEGAEVRMLRDGAPATSAPRQRGLDGQSPGEYSDVVHFLSSLLARHTYSAWNHAYSTHAEIGFPLHHGARSRVGRLRAYGNAINAQQAQIFIEAFIDYISGEDLG